MLEAKNSAGAHTNPSYQTLLAFKPRQVLLAERSTKVSTTMKQCSSRETVALNPDQKALLLQSVLGYLERNGFPKALKRLLSEAQIEVSLPLTSSPYTCMYRPIYIYIWCFSVCVFFRP